MRLIRFCKAAAVAAACIAAVSCTHDPGVPGPGNGDQARVRLHIKTPAPTRPGTRALGIEDSIGNICVLVLQQNAAGEYVFEYMAKGTGIEQSSATTAAFEAVLRVTGNPVKLILVANYPLDLTGQLPEAGTSEDELRATLTCDYTNLATLGIPMAGETELSSLTSGSNSPISVAMVRAVARVSVEVDLDDSPDFTMEELCVYRANDLMQLIPDLAAMDTTVAATMPRVDTASVPTAAVAMGGSLAAADITDYLYIPESVPALTSAQLLGATCVVVGGKFDNSDQTTYYRIDFNSELPGHPFGQVLRNHSYRFIIKKVSVPGEPDAQTAADNLSTALSVEIVQWDDSATDIYIPATNDYFTLDGRTVELPYEAGTKDSIAITSTLPFTLKIAGESGAVSSVDADAAGSAGALLSDSLFGFTIVRTAYDGTAAPPESLYKIVVTAKTDNDNENNAATLMVTVGLKNLAVSVTQNTQPTYVAPRTLTVYSIIDSYGALGSTYPSNSDTYSSDADSLRRMLQNPKYFGPNGVVKLDKLTLLKGGTGDYDNDSDTTAFAMTLESVDVIIMSGWGMGSGYPGSAACTQKIVEWSKDPAHTLIITLDNDAGNTKIRTALNAYLPYTFASMGWLYQDNSANKTKFQSMLLNGVTFSSTPNFTYGTAPDNVKAGDDIFLGASAAFGAVDRSLGFVDSDIICEISTGTLPDYVIPIIDVAAYGAYNSVTAPYETSAMIMGVDTRHNIVWMGESQVGGHTYGMKNANPVDNDGLTRIMGNLWGWIVNTANQ